MKSITVHITNSVTDITADNIQTELRYAYRGRIASPESIKVEQIECPPVNSDAISFKDALKLRLELEKVINLLSKSRKLNSMELRADIIKEWDDTIASGRKLLTETPVQL